MCLKMLDQYPHIKKWKIADLTSIHERESPLNIPTWRKQPSEWVVQIASLDGA
jgi:hypothetical protein